MGLKHSYTLIAPWYDVLVAKTFARARQASLAHLPATTGAVLIGGIGTGLDIPYLPTGPFYVGVDITRAMLKRAQARSAHIGLAQADVERLPFADGVFEHIVLHLILAVAPNAVSTLAEAARVLRPGGNILIYDKFLRRDQKAPLRRLLSPFLGPIATHTDRIFEDILRRVPHLELISDTADNLNGYFRRITLKRLSD